MRPLFVPKYFLFEIFTAVPGIIIMESNAEYNNRISVIDLMPVSPKVQTQDSATSGYG